MKNKIILSLVIFLGLTSITLAQELPIPEDIPEESQVQVATVATVNIYESKIISQEGDNVHISFDLSNREKAQPEIIYGVQLAKNTKDGQAIVDEKIYSEVISLAENQTIKKEIVYQVPEYLSSEYYLWVVAKNKSGMIFALNPVGEIMLDGDNEYTEIISESCYLQVEGESEDKKYTLKQGVDITKEESLVASCEIKNNFQESKTFIPKFETYRRSTFGENIGSETSEQALFTLNLGEKKTVQFKLPNPQVSQAYDTTIQLLDKRNEIISNSVVFHYVIHGPSATIQNLRLNKDYYQKGEVAVISFFWSASADGFPGSRLGSSDGEKMFLDMKITNKNNQACAEISQKELKREEINIEQQINITQDCLDPRIIVSIKDKNKNVLDEKELSIKSLNISQKQSVAEVVVKEEPRVNKIFIIATILTILLLVMIFFAKKKELIKMIIFLLILGGMMSFGGGGAKADTFTVSSTIFTASLNKATYIHGETIVASSSASTVSCLNGSGALNEFSSRVSFNTTINALIFNAWPIGSGSVSGLAENTAGNYSATFTGKIAFILYIPTPQQIIYTGSYSIPYNVVVPVTYSCTGTVPTNATLISGDDAGLMANTVRTVVSSNTIAKCEYTCDSGYIKSGNSCVPIAVTYSCTGTVPTNATLISGDDAGLMANTVRTVVSSNTIDKCEYTCDSGYIKSGNSCVVCSHAAYVCSSSNTGNICDGSTNCGNTITTIDKTCLDVDTCGDSTIVAQSLCLNCTDETETCTCSSGGGSGWIEVAP